MSHHRSGKFLALKRFVEGMGIHSMLKHMCFSIECSMYPYPNPNPNPNPNPVVYIATSGKERQGKKGTWAWWGKWSRKEGKSKQGRWKIENERRKSYKMRRGLFFFCFCFFVFCFCFLFLFCFVFFTFQNQCWNLFWVYQNRNFLPGKSISRWEKNQEKWLCPLWKIFLLRLWWCDTSCWSRHSIAKT